MCVCVCVCVCHCVCVLYTPVSIYLCLCQCVCVCARAYVKSRHTYNIFSYINIYIRMYMSRVSYMFMHQTIIYQLGSGVTGSLFFIWRGGGQRGARPSSGGGLEDGIAMTFFPSHLLRTSQKGEGSGGEWGPMWASPAPARHSYATAFRTFWADLAHNF